MADYSVIVTFTGEAESWVGAGFKNTPQEKIDQAKALVAQVLQAPEKPPVNMNVKINDNGVETSTDTGVSIAQASAIEQNIGKAIETFAQGNAT